MCSRSYYGGILREASTIKPGGRRAVSPGVIGARGRSLRAGSGAIPYLPSIIELTSVEASPVALMPKFSMSTFATPEWEIYH
jgi:hypothetical protein